MQTPEGLPNIIKGLGLEKPDGLEECNRNVEKKLGDCVASVSIDSVASGARRSAVYHRCHVSNC